MVSTNVYSYHKINPRKYFDDIKVSFKNITCKYIHEIT